MHAWRHFFRHLQRVPALGPPELLDHESDLKKCAVRYRDQGRWEEAEKLEVQVIETSSRVLGEEHPDTLTSMNNLVFTLAQIPIINSMLSF